MNAPFALLSVYDLQVLAMTLKSKDHDVVKTREALNTSGLVHSAAASTSACTSVTHCAKSFYMLFFNSMNRCSYV